MANGNSTSHYGNMKNMIRKVAKEGLDAEFIILNAEWQENSILLTVIDGDTSWSGKFILEEMVSFCETFNKPKEVYFSEITEALRCGNDFIFTLERESLVMKKIDARTHIKIRYCSIPLTKIACVPTYSHIVGRLLDNEVSYENRISQMTEELRFLKHEREDLLKNFELLINEKSTLETTLYSKFCEVLNSKKRKISSLQNELESSKSIDQNDPPKIKQEKLEEHSELEDNHLSRNNAEEYGEPSNHPGNSVLPGEAGGSVNHYDSETDIDTEEEAELQQQNSNCNVNKTVEEKKPPPPADISENKKRILPKRGSSKTSTQVTKKDIIVEKPAKASDEFNSQSLFDEF